MASTLPPNLAFHPYPANLDSTHVSQQSWVPQEQTSINSAPINASRAHTSGGPYTTRQDLSINLPTPFVLNPPQHDPLPPPYFAFGMGMAAPSPDSWRVDLCDRPATPRTLKRQEILKKKVFGEIPQPVDDLTSPISSYSSEDQWNPASDLATCSFEDLPQSEQEDQTQLFNCVMANLTARDKQNHIDPMRLPPESLELLTHPSPLSSDISNQSFDGLETDDVWRAPYADIIMDEPVDDSVTPHYAEPVVYQRTYASTSTASVPAFEYKTPPANVSPVQDQPTSFRIPPAANMQYYEQHAATSPNPHVVASEPPQYASNGQHWSPVDRPSLMSAYAPFVSPDQVMHPPRPFTADAAMSYAPRIVTDISGAVLNSPVEYSPVRPVTAPSSLPYDLKIPSSPIPDEYGQHSATSQHYETSFSSRIQPTVQISPVNQHGASFAVASPMSPGLTTGSPWPVQQPRKRHYSTKAKAESVKVEVVEGKKPRGRKPKDKEGTKAGKKAKEDGVPNQSVIKQPKKPASAWQLFFKVWVKQHMGLPRYYEGSKGPESLSVHKEVKLASTAYGQLPAEEIEKWENLSKEEKIKYDKAVKQWEKTLRPELIEAENQFRSRARRLGINGRQYKRTNMKNPNEPPKPLSAFFRFQKEIQDDPVKRERYFGDVQDAKMRAKMAAEEWRRMTPEQKKPYLDGAAHDKAIWDETRAVYREMIEPLPMGAELPDYPTLEEAREWVRRRSEHASLSTRTALQATMPQVEVKPEGSMSRSVSRKVSA